MNSLTHLVDAALAVEKVRVRSQVRQSHLALNGLQDHHTDILCQKLVDLESWVDGRVAVLIKDHPAYPWFSRVKGVGKENIGKVVAQVRVKPEKGEDKDGNTIDLPYANTISGLWAFAGFSVENGKAPKRVTGSKLEYNSQLRSMCWRLGGSLMKAGGCFKVYYDKVKAEYVERYASQGTAIVPAAQLPTIVVERSINGQQSTLVQKYRKKMENDKFISEGHIHNMALRRMVKIFLACLWLEWRKAEGLPITTPYAMGVLGHPMEHMINPSDMTDR